MVFLGTHEIGKTPVRRSPAGSWLLERKKVVMYFYLVIAILTVTAPAAYLFVRKLLARRAGVPAPTVFDSPLQLGVVIAASWITYVFAVQACYEAALANALDGDGRQVTVPTFEQARELGLWHKWLPPSALMVHQPIGR